MNSKKWTNHEALYNALNIYIDTMRPFILTNLKSVIHLPPKDRFHNEADIDIGDFSRLIRTYLDEAFKSHFDRYWDVCTAVDTINEARNKISHPGTEDLTWEYANSRLFKIADILGQINAPEQKREVEAIRDKLLTRTQSTPDVRPDKSQVPRRKETELTPSHNVIHPIVSSEQFKHIQQIRMGFHEGSEKLKSSLNNSIATLADDLYNKDIHFVFELIQNAEDNLYEKHNTHPPYISFRLTKTDPTFTSGSNGALIIQNNETGFNRENVEAICAVGETTKIKDQGYIGEKGIGFKSVFRVTDNPHIFSNGYHFSLPKFDEETGLGYIVPQWTHKIPDGLDLSETHIILPLTKDNFRYKEIEEMLGDIEPEVILFLSTLQEIRIETDSGDKLTILKDNSAVSEVGIKVEGKKQGVSFSNSEKFLVCTKRYDKPSNISLKKRKGIDQRDVSVAFPLDQNSKAVGKIFAYLPVRSDTNFPFLINADFILPSSREDLQDVPWNHWLMKCVANLVTSDLLPLLKKRELLKVQFLEAMANRLNDLENEKDSLFYPIFTKVRDLFKDEQYLPTNKTDTYVSAQYAVLTRSNAVRNILSYTQLGELFSRPDDELKWLSDEITPDRTPALRQYVMHLLEIEEVTPAMLGRKISENFLSIQDDEWFVRFYKFLSDQPALWRDSDSVLRTKPILRLQNRTHVNPSQESSVPTAYLSDDTSIDASQPIVKLEIVQDKDAYRFLRALGVQEYDIVAEVIRTILPKYKVDSPTISHEEHRRDFERIKRAYDTDSQEKRTQLINALQDTPFILVEKSDLDGNNYFMPDQLYFGNDDLRLYFKGNPSYGFVNLDFYPLSAEILFDELGVMNSVRVARKEKDRQGHVPILSFHSNHKRGLDGFDPNIEVDGLEHTLKHALNDFTPEKSVFIWNQIAIPNTDCIKGTVEKSSKKNYENSTYEEEISDPFGRLLIDTKWLPDVDGNMHKPSEISIDALPDSFIRNEQLRIKLGMPMSRKRKIETISQELDVSSDFLSKIIEAPPKVIARIESILHSPSDNGLTGEPTSQDTPFPVKSVPDPERRKKHVIIELETAPDQEYERKVRSVRTSRDLIDDPKTWLTEQYRNEEGQVVCQICQEKMPFKYHGGNYYFDAVEMLKGHFTKEYAAQFLALCPECSSKYRTSVKQVPEAMNNLKNQLIEADNSGDFEVPVKLGDSDASIRFVERHWLDIKAILSFYAQQQSQIGENSVPEPIESDEQNEEVMNRREKSLLAALNSSDQQKGAEPNGSDQQNETSRGVRRFTNLKVTMHDKTVIHHYRSQDTYIEVLKKLDLEKVMQVRPNIVSRKPFTGYKTKGIKVDEFYVRGTIGFCNDDRTGELEKIARLLGVSLIIERVEKEVIVSMETKVGDENGLITKTKRHPGKKLNYQMVWEAVQAFTNGDVNVEFTLKDIERVVSDKHPDYNVGSVRHRIRGGCVNFPNRRNYPIDEDRYWWVEKGKYRLYDRKKDNSEGKAETSIYKPSI